MEEIVRPGVLTHKRENGYAVIGLASESFGSVHLLYKTSNVVLHVIDNDGGPTYTVIGSAEKETATDQTFKSIGFAVLPRTSEPPISKADLFVRINRFGQSSMISAKKLTQMEWYQARSSASDVVFGKKSRGSRTRFNFQIATNQSFFCAFAYTKRELYKDLENILKSRFGFDNHDAVETDQVIRKRMGVQMIHLP